MALKLTLNGETHEVSIVRRKPHLVLLVDGVEHEVATAPTGANGRHEIEIGGHRLVVSSATLGAHRIIRLAGRTYEVAVVDPFAGEGDGAGGHDAVRAPMPGAVVSVHFKAGDVVKRGEPIVTIESMKLQTALLAPRDGIIEAVRRWEGETFEKDEIIAVLQIQAEGAGA